MKPSEILEYAQGQIEQGWCKGTLVDHEGNVCMLGAMDRAATRKGGVSIYAPAYVSAFRTLHEKVAEFWNGPMDLDGIPGFNDDPKTTKQDVLDVFTKARLGLEERGE